MTVGVVTTSYPRSAGDYAGGFVEDGVRELCAAGERVEVIAAGEPQSDGPSLLPVTRVRFAGVRASLFYAGGGPEALEAGGGDVWLQAFRFTTGLCHEIARRAPGWDRVVSHWLVPCGLAVAAAAPRLPHRAHAHSGDVALLERLPLGDAVARRLAGSGAELVFVTAALRDRFAVLAGRCVGVVQPMSADPTLFSPAPPALRAALRAARGLHRPTVVTAGRLVPVKGLDVLICATARLGGGAPQLVMLGDGPERAVLKQLARRSCVDLHLPGAVARREVAAWLRAADLFAQPSRSLPGGRTEGMPVAVREALAVGLPVIASATGGVPELAAGVSQMTLVAPDDPAALAAALCTALRTLGGPVA